jgi:hypothetical protein
MSSSGQRLVEGGSEGGSPVHFHPFYLPHPPYHWKDAEPGLVAMENRTCGGRRGGDRVSLEMMRIDCMGVLTTAQSRRLRRALPQAT